MRVSRIANSERPPLAIFAMQKIAGRLGIHDLPAQRIVLNRPFHQRRKIDQLRELCQRPANIKTRESLSVPFARLDPFPLVTFHSRQRLWRTALESLKSLLRQQHVT